MKPALAAVALALVLPASATLAEDQKGPPAALVVVDHAVKQFVSPTAMYSATVISRDDAKLAGEIAGRLTWVAEVGDRFLKGETVARLDDTFFQQQVIEEQSIIQREQAKFDFHTRQVERLEELLKENNIARSQVDQERMDRSVAHNNILSAQARLSQAKERLKRTSILAPFDGVVSERWLQAGEWADNGDAIVRLVSSDNLEIETHIPASSLKLVTVGTPLTYTDEKISGTGTVRTIVPIGGDVSRLYELRLSVTNPSLSAGNLLRVAVPTALPRETVLVPRDALVLRREGIYVYRVNQESIAEKIAVQTGIATLDRIEVIGGIREHDRVVIRGGENLRPGMPVQVKPL
ncbi:MAG: efflux RND transporter periplasmic adaptor subunit [Gammaproteobacteria bacterium]|nr:efflux RND transporter periplasmic adaptor subunit [Gammaproteobacteria bacterium]